MTILTSAILVRVASASEPSPLEKRRAQLRALEPRLAALIRGRQPHEEIRLRSLVATQSGITVGIEVPRKLPKDPPPTAVENAFEDAVGFLLAHEVETPNFDLAVGYPNDALVAPKRHVAPSRRARALDPSPIDRERFPFGAALWGKTVVLSPGHGAIFSDALGAFTTQRARVAFTECQDCRGIIEDFATHEFCVRYLVPLLEGAGARAVLVRERSFAKDETIVDDEDPAFRAYSPDSQRRADENAYRRRHVVATGSAATASWTLNAPSRGPQLLSLWFSSHESRTREATFEVIGSFGTQAFFVDQRTHGRRWSPIATFDVDRGEELTLRLKRAPLALDSSEIAFDAVRLGSPTHASGFLMWQMGARPYAEYQNAPAEILTHGDVTTRPLVAEFLGGDAYVSLHTNAAGVPQSTARGTSSYRYNCGSYPDHSPAPPPSACDDPAQSARLQDSVHDSLIEVLTNRWDPKWRDRRALVANFGELRELGQIPGVLIELAFHDNVRLASPTDARMTDNQALHDPVWRRAAAFGVYRGLSEFFVEKGPLVLDPPNAIVARRVTRSSVRLDFSPVAGARAYRVYVAQGSRVFNRGPIVASTPPTILVEALREDVPTLLMIRSLNEAGEGPPSRVVVARPSQAKSQILLVDAFTREDAWVDEMDHRTNSLMVHGLALASAPHAFDGATQAALDAGFVDIAEYDGVAFAWGKNAELDATWSTAEQDKIAAFAQRGGAIFASGGDIGRAFFDRGDARARALLQEIFGAQFEADSVDIRSLVSATGGPLEHVLSTPVVLEDGSGDALWARSTDVFRAIAPGLPLMQVEGTSRLVAVARERRWIIGAALESVKDANDRALLVSTWAKTIALAPPEASPDAGPDASQDATLIALPDAGHLNNGGDVPFYAVHAIRGECACASAQDARSRTAVRAVGLALIGLCVGARRRLKYRARTGPRHKCKVRSNQGRFGTASTCC